MNAGRRFPWPAMIGLAALLVVGLLISLLAGSVSIPPAAVLEALLGRPVADDTWRTILLDFRLPKALTAILAGAALAVGGLQMQTLFRNPLAEPFILGISAGASLGVALVVLGLGGLLGGGTLLAGSGVAGGVPLVVAASLGAAGVLLLVLFVSRWVTNSTTLLILGLMFGYATSSVVTILVHFALAERVRAYVAWANGSFGGVTWGQLKVLAPAVLGGLLVAGLLVKALDALLLGEEYAASLGLRVGRARGWIIASAALLAGAVTAYCGPIGFLGVAVPHFCRGLFRTAEHRVLLPAAALLGGLLALAADWVAQVPGSQLVLPVNAVTALVGAPVVSYVILTGGAGRRLT